MYYIIYHATPHRHTHNQNHLKNFNLIVTYKNNKPTNTPRQTYKYSVTPSFFFWTLSLTLAHYLPPSQGKLSANKVNNLSDSKHLPRGPNGTRHTGHFSERLRQLLHRT